MSRFIFLLLWTPGVYYPPGDSLKVIESEETCCGVPCSEDRGELEETADPDGSSVGGECSRESFPECRGHRSVSES